MKIFGQGWQTFSGHVPKLSINFEAILLVAHGNSEEENKVLGVSHNYF
jgi:hypothetical protein